MRKKKIDLEKIPELLERAVAVISKELDALADKSDLTADEARTLISYCGLLSNIYKEYRAEVKALELDLKTKNKEAILQIINTEGKK
jgi:hypothetical protein